MKKSCSLFLLTLVITGAFSIKSVAATNTHAVENKLSKPVAVLSLLQDKKEAKEKKKAAKQAQKAAKDSEKADRHQKKAAKDEKRAAKAAEKQ